MIVNIQELELKQKQTELLFIIANLNGMPVRVRWVLGPHFYEQLGTVDSKLKRLRGKP